MSDQIPKPDETRMFREAGESADVVERQLQTNDAIVARLAQTLRATPPRFIVTCARGSSDHAATFAKYVFETQIGLMTASASPSVSSIYHTEQKLDGALYIAISQSGKSPDLVRHAQGAKRAGAHVVALVNVEDSPLAAVADTVVPLRAGPELSVAATKSYLCALSAIVHIAARWKNDAALFDALRATPAAMRATWQMDWSPLVSGLVEARNLFVVGRGLGLGAAQEAALKLKETCGLHAEAFSAAEVKHGPMALVGQDFPVLFLAQRDESWEGTRELAKEFAARGAKVWITSPDVAEPHALPVAEAPHPVCAPLIAIQGFYRAANALAIRRGRNPDVPPHLNKVTQTV
ncbi:MAG TPA: SIS domain-containing protein [Rudaea sp.]|jgi:glucosamine--fructose-6-phosphate aminotransferase (isomerizing)|uniref:SIS domain-containing protein n=1 Tax=Rudaea sp. TaxID=2136325 RepID=UPI002F937B99